MDRYEQISRQHELLTEIAIAYYEYEMTQEEIARKYNISRIKVGRMLKKARSEGIVEIKVKYHPVYSSHLEQQLIEKFGIERALIALDYSDEAEQRRQVAALVDSYLSSLLKDGMTVAVGQGRNVTAVANHPAQYPERLCKFICGIGGTHRSGDTIDADHISRQLAQKFSATSETLYAPAYVEKRELKDAFMQNGVVKETLDRARKADIALVGLGDMNENSYMVKLGWFTPQEIIHARMYEGVTGEIAGYSFFNARGETVDTVMSERVIGLSVEELRQIPCVIAIASESSKAMAIAGALHSGVIDVIATSAANVRLVLSLN